MSRILTLYTSRTTTAMHCSMARNYVVRPLSATYLRRHHVLQLCHDQTRFCGRCLPMVRVMCHKHLHPMIPIKGTRAIAQCRTAPKVTTAHARAPFTLFTPTYRCRRTAPARQQTINFSITHKRNSIHLCTNRTVIGNRIVLPTACIGLRIRPLPAFAHARQLAWGVNRICLQCEWEHIVVHMSHLHPVAVDRVARVYILCDHFNAMRLPLPPPHVHHVALVQTHVKMYDSLLCLSMVQRHWQIW
jgi:hypothetical protein